MPGLVRPVTDERDALLSFLEQQRYVIRVATFGLDDQGARATPTKSGLSVGGTIRHLTGVERFWISIVKEQVLPSGSEEDYDSGFRMEAGLTLSELLDDYALAGSETESVITSIADMGALVPVPKGVPWFPQDVEEWSIRWILLHVLEETARHAGHIDLLREHVDGACAFPLIAAVEDWPETPWLKPWKAAV